MSIRVDHIAELIPNENATKLPVNYGFAKINFMPERMEGEAATQEIRQIDENIRFANPALEKDAVEALSSNKRQYFGAHRDLDDGYPVGIRIDIPAFTSKGVYVVTVHEKKKGGERGQVGERIGYDTIAKVDNPVFFSNEVGAKKIKSGEANKFPVATVEGQFNSSREIPEDINEWTPVGYNPREHSYFYDKRNDEPVLSGDEAISVGNTVFVKNPVYGDKANFAFMPQRPAEQEPTIGEKTEISPKIDADYMKAVEGGDMETAQRMVDEKLANIGAFWHGTPSGDLSGGITGLHVGTKQAAMVALEARIGIPADGKGWNGDKEYGKTLLAGRDRIEANEFGKYRLSGYNVDAPNEDYYPTKMPTVGKDTPVNPKWKPWIRPVLIVGEMTNTQRSPISDAAANRKIQRKRGAFYTNEGEDVGSVSAVLPNGDSVRVKLADPVTYDDAGNVIPLSQRFNPKTSDIRFMPERPVEEERIVSATYTDPRTGEVREGVNHKEANPNAPDEQTDRESRYYGFKTDTGRVVDREEAYRIAEESGQLKEATSEEDRFNADRGVLHSNMVEMEPTISEKPQSSEMIGAETIKPADLQTSAKPATDAVIKPYSNALVSSVGLINFLPAYHGTPYDVDKFKLANIGTGEGAQAYGWGLYFAQARKTGEKYRNDLSGYDELTIFTDKGKKKGQQLDDLDMEAAKYLESGARTTGQFKHNTVYYAKQAAERDGKQDVVARIDEYGRDAKVTYEKNLGNLYKVDIDVKDEDLLDWDKPLSEQPESVRDAITALIKERIPKEIADAQLNKLKTKGGSLYALISDSFGESAQGTPEKRASEALLAAGIPGIRYLDGMSRTSASDINRRDELLKEVPQLRKTLENNPRDWEMRKQFEDWLTSSEQELAALERQIKSAETAPTHNYVVFDENLITILDKNDKPVAGELPTKQPLSGIQFMPQRPVGKTQVGYDDTYLKSALASGTNGKVNLTRPIKPNEALPLLSQRVPITNEVDRDSFDYNSHGAVILYYHNGKPVTFKYDPQLIRRPQFKDISVEHAGKVVQLAMADRHTASGGDMGGPIHPWLKSLEEVEIYDPVTGQYLIGKWANNEWKPAKSMKDKSRAGATDLLVYTMDKESHGSNLRSIRIISNEIDNANLTQPEKNAFLVIANKAVKIHRLSNQNSTIDKANKSIEEIKTKLKEETDKNKISKLNDELNSELKRISKAEEKIKNYTISQDENDFSAIVRNYKAAMTRYQNGTGSEKAYKGREEELKNYMKTPAFKKLQKEVSGVKMINLDNTFDGRKAAEESLKGLTINKFNIDHILQEISDFENGDLHHFVASVELSRNPDLMAVYLGDDPNQAKFMTQEEAAAAKIFKANPNFVIHEAYSWLMLGPKNGNDFLNTNPKTHLDYFPWFKQQWANLKTDPAARDRILKLGNDNLMNTMRDQKSIPLVMPKK
jgi:hypothetical protein